MINEQEINIGDTVQWKMMGHWVNIEVTSETIKQRTIEKIKEGQAQLLKIK